MDSFPAFSYSWREVYPESQTSLQNLPEVRGLRGETLYKRLFLPGGEREKETYEAQYGKVSHYY